MAGMAVREARNGAECDQSVAEPDGACHRYPVRPP